MSVSIKYKGAEIASANIDTTKTIKTSGQYCEADIEVINTPDGDAPVINPLSVTENGTYTAPSGVDGYSPITVNVPQGITPSGNINITDINVTDVSQYETAQVVDADLVAENIKKDVNILGVVGSFEGGGSVDIEDGIVVTARNENGYPTSVEKYGDCGPYEFHYASGSNRFRYLTNVVLKNAVSAGSYAFQNSVITSISGLENLKTLGVATFRASNISVLNLSSVTQITGDVCFRSSTATEINMPSVSVIAGQTFYSCTSLQTVNLGSVGHTFSQMGNDSFQLCPQTGLTITVFTIGDYVGSVLTNFRSGATNATIIIKASEDTEYNGVSYSAGETIVTSEVEA